MVIQAETPEIENTVRMAVEEVLRERLATYGFARAHIRPGRDQDGDPVILVDVQYDLIDRPISSKVTFGLPTAVRQALWKVGETRFPHIRHHFNKQQKIAS